MSNSKALNATNYNQHAGWQYATATELLGQLELNGNESILDIGSGDGEVTKKIGQHVPSGHVLGIDIAPDMINFAVKHKGSSTNVDYQLLDAEALSTKQTYDLITAFSSFYWIKNQGNALKKIYRALKKRGRIFFMLFPKESPYWQPLVAALSAFEHYIPLSQHHHFLSTDEYKHILPEIGFKGLNIKEEILIADYTDKADYTNYIRGWVRSLVPLSATTEEDAFLALAYQKACEQFGVTQKGKLLIPYKKVIITAIKEV